MPHPDFENVDIRVPVSRQVIVIGLEVVGPLVDEVAGIVFEVFFEVIHRYRFIAPGALSSHEFYQPESCPA